MKKGFRTLTMMLLSLCYLFSCSEEDTRKEVLSTNCITFYGLPFPLEKGAIYHDNDHILMVNKPYVFLDRYLTEEGVQKVDTIKGFTANLSEKKTGNFLLGLYEGTFKISPEMKRANGEGASICLRLASPDVERLVPGKYTFSNDRNEFTFTGHSMVEYSTVEATVPEPNILSEGELEVIQEGEKFTVKFDCKTDNGGIVRGEYQGALEQFDIRKIDEAPIFFKDMTLEATYDTIKGWSSESMSSIKEQDGTKWDGCDTYAMCLFIGQSKGIMKTATVSMPKSAQKPFVELALAFDRKNDAICFLPPIELRTGRHLQYDLLCHTKYMWAPDTFTNDDFEHLSVKDCLFPITEERVSVPVTTPPSLPCFVFIETGTQFRGVIRIKKIIPKMGESEFFNYNKLVLDIKYAKSPAGDLMR